MRARLVAAAIAGVLVLMVFPAAGSASSSLLRRPAPLWWTPTLAAQVHAAGAAGVQVPADELNTSCPGFQAAGVQATACEVAPYGCSGNFIYTDGSSYYIGTASHCTDKIGQPVTMQVDTTTIADVGTVSYRTSTQEPGADFAMIKLYPAVVSQWGVNPAIPVIGGPNGIYTGCGPVAVENYGHGYVVAVAQGKPEGGLATNWFDDGYGWTGLALPGDSGDAVIVSGGQAAGNLTHLIVDTAYPGSDTAGTRITKILNTTGLRLVNADGSTTGGASTNCGNP